MTKIRKLVCFLIHLGSCKRVHAYLLLSWLLHDSSRISSQDLCVFRFFDVLNLLCLASENQPEILPQIALFWTSVLLTCSFFCFRLFFFFLTKYLFHVIFLSPTQRQPQRQEIPSRLWIQITLGCFHVLSQSHEAKWFDIFSTALHPSFLLCTWNWTKEGAYLICLG